MPALNIPVAQQAAVLVATSVKYKIPIKAMVAIYGTETGFGSNVTTSSAGAVGPFQFIPSTAAQWGYPQTNTPTLAQFQQQADAWGRFLVAGNPSKAANGWAPAMGGGYTQAQADATLVNIPAALKAALVQAQIGSLSQPNVPGLSDVGAGAAAAVGAVVPDVAGAISAVWKAITTPAMWLTILKFVGGAVLLYMGLHGLTGAGPSPGDIAKHAPVPV
jgi:hypothetical protein